eukprot:33484_1
MGNTISTRSCSNESFIIRHKNNENSNIIDANSLEQRRVVFISLIGLYETYKLCPAIILYSSLFVVSMNREWIYHPLKYRRELQSHPISHYLQSDKLKRNEFMELLKWKDKQGLVLWMLSDYPYPSNCKDKLIQPFWYHLSERLRTLHDPVTNSMYQPLHLEEQWWVKNCESVTKYNATTTELLSELYLLSMKYRTMQEIIYQSNPNSLLPITRYGQNNDVSRYRLCHMDDDEKDDPKRSWWISLDYEPNML